MLHINSFYSTEVGKYEYKVHQKKHEGRLTLKSKILIRTKKNHQKINIKEFTYSFYVQFLCFEVMFIGLYFF
jgi:DNA helicase IV